ncbi:DUF2147 domain-containing protein [Mesorhizobium sp. BAC0120]|uniref:DUF2147 domain-containing protein n=1 Tax=Mesorhizobium sp. BAC0120 TaxID=3090670 RepID=UPI00298CA3E8|nr:DUF2147 domain-containing protein [Mesorhizobium sp. BAC0120]MDW6025466.1 DUF2147 domain-containing protein [Mesorhizobium sp. BAC0120]
MLQYTSINPFGRRAVTVLGTALVASAFAAGNGAASNGDVFTTWQTNDGKAVVEIYRCEGEKLCGRIVWLNPRLQREGSGLVDANNPDPSLRNRSICGLEVLKGLTPDQNGAWDGGRVYDPEEGRSYNAALASRGPNEIAVTGYLGLRALGETMIWHKRPLAASQRCEGSSRRGTG